MYSHFHGGYIITLPGLVTGVLQSLNIYIYTCISKRDRKCISNYAIILAKSSLLQNL